MRRRDRVLMGAVVATCLACRLAAGAPPAPWVTYPFNGKDLDGWEACVGKQPSLWRVGTAELDPADPGRLVVKAGGNDLVNVVPSGVQGCDLISKPRWGDCRIEIEVMVSKGSNSGIYVMGTEIQVLDGLNNRAGPKHNMGAIYGYHAPAYFPAEWRDRDDLGKEWTAWSKTDEYTACLSKVLEPHGQWQKFVIEFELGRTDPVTKATTPARFRRVELNGVVIHENVELQKGPRGPGTLMLQGNHGPVAYRNIKITPLAGEQQASATGATQPSVGTISVAAGSVPPPPAEGIARRVGELGGTSERNAAGEIISIIIPESEADDSDIARFALCPKLGRLEVHSSHVHDDSLKALAAAPHLRVLGVRFASITDAGLAHLAHNRTLEVLDLRGCVQIGDAGVAHLKELTGLRVLKLQTPGVTDKGLPALAGLKNLQTLALEQCAVTGDGLRVLAAFPKLTELSLMQNQILEDEHLQPVGALTQLTRLNLRWTPIDGSGLRHVRNLTKLQRVNLAQTMATDAALEAMRDCADMRWLDLWQTSVSDAGLRHVRGMKKLEHLELHNTPITNASLADISQLSALEYLGLAQTRLDDDAIADLVKLKHLKRLDVSLTGITPDGIKALQSALPACKIEQ